MREPSGCDTSGGTSAQLCSWEAGPTMTTRRPVGQGGPLPMIKLYRKRILGSR